MQIHESGPVFITVAADRGRGLSCDNSQAPQELMNCSVGGVFTGPRCVDPASTGKKCWQLRACFTWSRGRLESGGERVVSSS